jgi:myo-inositol-1(or 4)-monophosphatase
VSETKRLQDCVAGLNFDERDLNVIQALLTRNPTPAKIRRTGSSALDSVYVANGSYDAYIDVGNILTGESFLASTSIIIEAGGIVSDQQGKDLRPITNLTDGFSLVTAGTRELHKEIIARIQEINVS